ncbi:MAG: transposase [Pirellulaceae bacterium]
MKSLRESDNCRGGGKFAYLSSDENWEAFVRNLASTQWVAYIQPPPSETSRANEVVNYLTRYLTGGPISDHRITAADDRHVTFLARQGDKTGGERQQVPVTLKLDDFVRRWCLHIQPDQLTKTRYLGGWSGQHRATYMARCRELLDSSDGVTDSATSQPDSTAPVEIASTCSVPDPIACARCGSDRLLLIESIPKPSWRDLFNARNAACPEWYAQWRRVDDERFWDGLMGEGFNDWYLENVLERAEEPAPPPPPPKQLFFPGFAAHPAYC